MREQQRVWSGVFLSVALCVWVLLLSACEEAAGFEGGRGREDGGTSLPAQFGIGATTPPIVTPAIIITPQPSEPDGSAPDASEPDGGEPDAGEPQGPCGDGEISGDEVCDPGVQPCCNARCDGPASASRVCGEELGRCDIEERCDGETFECPEDAVEDEGVVCRAAADLCDRPEVCTGEDAMCPSNARRAELDACNDGLGQCSSDICCPGATVNLGDDTCGSALDARLAFVTELDHDGAMGGLDGADALCNAAAAEANLNGTYHAWLSSPGPVGAPAPISAVRRVTYSALARVDGVLVSNSLDELLSNDPLAPIARTAWNEPRDVAVWTGTNGRGSSSGTSCSSWATNTNAESAVVGDSGEIVGWTDGASLTCDVPAALYCFQDDCKGRGRVDFTSDNDNCGACGNACGPELTCIAGQCGARVFVSSAVTPGSIDAAGVGALVAADALCNNYAAVAVLSGTYVAWLSTPSDDASLRILDAPYFRTDDVQVAAGRAQLLSSLATPLLAPIDRNERATQVGAGTPVWTGTSASGGFDPVANATCVDWSTNARTQAGMYGSATETSGAWTNVGAMICLNSASLYCFQVSRTPLRGVRIDGIDGP
jgi:hypothetical protein